MKPTVCAALIEEMEMESAATRRLLECVPAQHLEWRPHPKAMTLGQLAMHVATVPSANAMFVEDTFDASKVDFRSPQPRNVSELQAALDQSLATARSVLGAWSAEDLARTWRLTMGSREVMAGPRASYVRTIGFNHLYHHRGQLSTYLRTLGVALPSVYGPTADQSPFA